MTKKGKVVAGSKRELKKYCRKQHLADRWIKNDGQGKFYLLLGDRCRGMN